MILRPLELSDLIDLEKCHNGDFPLPNINSKLYFVQKILEKDGEIIGGSFAKLTSEITVVLNKSLGKKDKVEALKKITEDLAIEFEKHAIDDTHVFIVPEDNEEFALVLERHFGFVRAKGIPLYRRV